MELKAATCQVKSKSYTAIEREFREHAVAKAMNRVDRREMKRKQRCLQFLAFVVSQIAFREGGFDRRADSCAKFGRRLLGERHDEDLIDPGGAGKEEADDDMLNRKRLAGARACVDNFVAAVENLIESRGSAVSDVGSGCGRAHLKIPTIGRKRRSTISSISSSSGGSKLVALRTGPYSELLREYSFRRTRSTASTRSRLSSDLRNSLTTSSTASIGKK